MKNCFDDLMLEIITFCTLKIKLAYFLNVLYFVSKQDRREGLQLLLSSISLQTKSS